MRINNQNVSMTLVIKEEIRQILESYYLKLINELNYSETKSSKTIKNIYNETIKEYENSLYKWENYYSFQISLQDNLKNMYLSEKNKNAVFNI